MNLCRITRTALFSALTVAGLAVLAAPSLAQYPNKPVRLIVPFPAGGATDAAARELGEGLARILGQPFFIENRPGADGAIAAQTVLTAPADGYVLLFGSSSMEGIPFTQKSSPLQSLNDLTPVSLVCRLVFGVLVHPGVPARSVQEFIAFARENPGKLNYGSGSLSEMMAATQFMKATGTSMVKIGYKGGAQIVPDLASGRLQVSFGPLTPMLPFVRDGRINVLAVLMDRSASVVPNAPSLKSAGVAPVSGAGGLQAVFGPPRMAPEAVQRLTPAIRSVVSDPDVRAKFMARGQEPETSTPEALAEMIRSERAVWERFVADENIKPE